jgi:hypothetical protein
LWDVAWAGLSCIPGTKGLTTLAALKNAYRHGGLGEAGAHVLAAGRAAVNEMARSLRAAWSARHGGLDAMRDAPKTWVGENDLKLVGEDLAMVKAFVVDATRFEPGLTRTMARMIGDLPTSRLAGFGARLKTFDSLARKTATVSKDPEVSVAEAVGNLKDSVRYTVETPGEDFAVASKRLVERLADEGFENLQFKNTFGSSGYQGINTTWRDAGMGHNFEVQFHTPESFTAKSKTHQLYEQIRLLDPDSPRVAELRAMQNQVFDAVPRPPSASGIALPPGARTAEEQNYVADTGTGDYELKVLQAVGYTGIAVGGPLDTER